MAEPALPSQAPVRRRRRHCVVVRPTTRRRRRQPQLPAMTLSADGDPSAGGDEYLVEKIIGERYDPRTGRRVFRVRWQGYTPEHDTWEPEANLAAVREFVEAYRRERSARLQERLLKRKGKRSEEGYRRRMGSWEYVPTSELVAKKTRFFDDLAEGRIDVRSDDLYSRVKCRRRQNGSDDEAEGPEQGEKENLDSQDGADVAGRAPGKPRGTRSRRERPGGRERRGRRRPAVKAEPEAPVEAPVEAVVKPEVKPEAEEKPASIEDAGDQHGSGSSSPHLQREASSDISPPELSPVTPVSPKSPVALSPCDTAPKLHEAPEVRSRGPKPGRKPRPPHSVQRRRLVQKVSPNMQQATVPPVSGPGVVPFLSAAQPPPPPPPPPPPDCVDAVPMSFAGSAPPASETSAAAASVPAAPMAFAPAPPRLSTPPGGSSQFFPTSTALPCLGAPSIRPEILEKMIDDCMSQNQIPDVNPLLSYMVDDAKTPPPALVSAAAHEWVDSEREQMDAYLQASASCPPGFEALGAVPHLRPPALPCGGRASNVQLRVAVLQNNYSLVRTLLAAQPAFTAAVYDLEQRDGDGESLLVRCVRQGHRHMAELLLQFGAITESPRRSDGATPLMLAVDAGQYHMSRVLLDYGASPDHQNRLGETSLHRAVRRGHTAIVDLLWRRGVDFSRVDAHLQTALKSARTYPLPPCQPQIERMLVGFLQTHNQQLNLAWTSCLARHNLEPEALLYPPTGFLSVAHCPHNQHRFQLQVPTPGPEPSSGPLPGAHLLLLVHALPDHPGLFWLEDGPCVVESVALNGAEQRRFGQQWFLSSLCPLMTGATNEVELKFSPEQTTAAQFRNLRLVILAIKVKARPLPGPNLLVGHQPAFPAPPQVQRSPIGVMPPPAVVAGSNNQLSSHATMT